MSGPDRILVGTVGPVRVGVVRWAPELPRITVVAKIELSFAGERLVLVPPSALSLEEDEEGEPFYPTDFVPRKPRVDVLVAGFVWGEAGEALPARVKLGDLDRRVIVRTLRTGTQAALDEALVFAPDGTTETRLGPRPGDTFDPRSSDRGGFNVAPQEQQLAAFEPRGELVLEGLSPRGVRRFEWPELVVAGGAERPDDRVAELELRCDTIWIDTLAERIALVYRDDLTVPLLERSDISRIVVGVREGELDYERVLRELPRGRFSFAAEPDELRTEPLDEDEEDTVLMAKYESWGHDEPPEPSLTLERYAAISAELMEGRDERPRVLERHKLDEDAWFVEERAWLQRAGDAAMEGNGEPAAEIAEATARARAALATPEEETWTVERYARLRVLHERTLQGDALVREHGLVPGQWARIDERFRGREAREPSLRAELHAAIARVESELGPAREPTLADFGVPAFEDDEPEEIHA